MKIGITNSIPSSLVTFTEDGGVQTWSHESTVDGIEDTRLKGCAHVNEHEATSCEWTTRSQYRRSSCGRTAVKNLWGLSLCWQHEDGVIHHVTHKLRNDEYPVQHVDLFAQALIGTRYSPGPYSSPDGPPYKRLVRAEVVRYINELAETGSVDQDVAAALDKLITSRVLKGLS